MGDKDDEGQAKSEQDERPEATEPADDDAAAKDDTEGHGVKGW